MSTWKHWFHSKRHPGYAGDAAALQAQQQAAADNALKQKDLDTEMNDYGHLGEKEHKNTEADMRRAGTWSGTSQGDESANAEATERTHGAQTASKAHINALRASLGLPPLDLQSGEINQIGDAVHASA